MINYKWLFYLKNHLKAISLTVSVFLPGSIPSVLGESRGAKIVTYRTTTLLQRRKKFWN
jgi:hypothetical protein